MRSLSSISANRCSSSLTNRELQRIISVDASRYSEQCRREAAVMSSSSRLISKTTIQFERNNISWLNIAAACCFFLFVVFGCKIFAFSFASIGAKPVRERQPKTQQSREHKTYTREWCKPPNSVRRSKCPSTDSVNVRSEKFDSNGQLTIIVIRCTFADKIGRFSTQFL